MGSWDVHLFIDDDVVDKLNASHEGCTDCALLKHLYNLVTRGQRVYIMTGHKE